MLQRLLHDTSSERLHTLEMQDTLVRGMFADILCSALPKALGSEVL